MCTGSERVKAWFGYKIIIIIIIILVRYSNVCNRYLMVSKFSWQQLGSLITF